MAATVPLSGDTYVRDLPFSIQNWLCQRLNPFDSWEDLASNIPVNYEDLLSSQPGPFEPRYETHNIFAFKSQRNPTKSLLTDWEMENCCIKHLVQALRNASLFDAANHICRECGHATVSAPPQPPQQQRAGRGQQQQRPLVPTEDEVLQENVLSYGSGGTEMSKVKDVPPQPPSPAVQVEQMRGKDFTDDTSLEKNSKSSPDLVQPIPEFSFELLRRITRNFDTRDKSEGGNRIGTGGFGDVFFGEFLGHKLAVKRLKETNEDTMKQFDTELKTLCAYKHENLVTLMGFCSDGLSLCLVYEYVQNGSLEDRLACMYGSSPLSVPQRLEIARGTARGIHYLHEEGVTHRDIKTANILLDKDYKPKVSDFATARSSQKAVGKDSAVDNKTKVIIGTTFYLDPEALDHVIHPALDVYSFGVVILELITGLPVYDPERKEEDLKFHVQEYCTPVISDDDDDDYDNDDDEEEKNCGTIFDLLDAGPGVHWDSALAEELYTLSKQCLERRRNRKTIKKVLESLDAMVDLYVVDEGLLPEK